MAAIHSGSDGKGPGQHPGVMAVGQLAAGGAAPPAATAPAAKPKRAPTEYTKVKMSDGREVEFAGKRKLDKTVLFSKDAEAWHEAPQAADDEFVKVRFDFRNGETREHSPVDGLLLTFIGHGVSQKIGDETASDEKIEDMIVHVDDIIEKLNEGKWSTREPGESFGGAHVVIKALVEASGKTTQEIKAYLQGKLDSAKAKGETLTRNQLYMSFRNPKSTTGKIIRRLEEEEAAKATTVDADQELAALAGV